MVEGGGGGGMYGGGGLSLQGNIDLSLFPCSIAGGCGAFRRLFWDLQAQIRLRPQKNAPSPKRDTLSIIEQFGQTSVKSDFLLLCCVVFSMPKFHSVYLCVSNQNPNIFSDGLFHSIIGLSLSTRLKPLHQSIQITAMRLRPTPRSNQEQAQLRKGRNRTPNIF